MKTNKAVFYEPIKGSYRVFFYDNVYHKIGPITGSYNIIFCRLFGISYVDFLKMIVSDYHASLKGKNSKYVGFSFDNEEDIKRFCNEINYRWSYITKSDK